MEWRFQIWTVCNRSQHHFQKYNKPSMGYGFQKYYTRRWSMNYEISGELCGSRQYSLNSLPGHNPEFDKHSGLNILF